MNAAMLFRAALLLLLAAVFPPASSAQEAAPILLRLWPEGRMPGHGAPQAEGTFLSSNDGKPRIVNVSEPTLAVYPADRPDAPALVIAPGGGYAWLAYDKEGVEIARWLNGAGITALVLKYRVPDNREGALQDIQRALRLTRANAAAWHVDPGRLGVIGFSAGGHLCARAATQYGSPAYAPLDAADGESARPDFAVLVYPGFLEIDGALNPELRFPADMPPLLFFSNADDTLCGKSGVVFDKALSGAGIAHRFILYPSGGHGHGLHSTGASADWTRDLLVWLAKTVPGEVSR